MHKNKVLFSFLIAFISTTFSHSWAMNIGLMAEQQRPQRMRDGNVLDTNDTSFSLFDAVMQRDLEEVSALLPMINPSDLHDQYVFGINNGTLLHWAIRWYLFDAHGKKQNFKVEMLILQALIATKVCINDTDSSGKTPLHIATSASCNPFVHILLKADCDVNAKDLNGDTPLHIAAKRNLKKAVEALLGAGADVTIKNNRGDTPLHVAAYFGSARALSALLKHDGMPVDTLNGDGHTPFYVAIAGKLQGPKRLKCVQMLLDAGACLETDVARWITYSNYEKYVEMILNSCEEDVNHQDSETGDTLLHAVAKHRSKNLVNAFLAAGANPFIVNNENKTPDQVVFADGFDAKVKKDMIINTRANTHLQRRCAWAIKRAGIDYKAEPNLPDALKEHIDHDFRDYSANIRNGH